MYSKCTEVHISVNPILKLQTQITFTKSYMENYLSSQLSP